MARNYTKKQIVDEVVRRHGKLRIRGTDTPQYSEAELNQLRKDLTSGSPWQLTAKDVKKINGLARNPKYGTIYSAFNRVRLEAKNPRGTILERMGKNQNPDRPRSDITPAEVKERVRRATGTNISTADATRKATRENSTNATVAFWEDAIAMGMPTNLILTGLAKVGMKVLPTVLKNPTVNSIVSKAVQQGAKIPSQLSSAARKVADRVGYQVAGRLPRPSTPQGSFNYDMARIAGGMDRALARSTIPPGSASRIPPPLSDKIQAGAARIMSEPPVGPASELSAALPASVRANAARIMAEPPVGASLPVASRARAVEQLRPTSGRTTGPVQESPVGGVTPLMGQRADALAKLGSRRMNPPLSADARLATQYSQYGYGRDAAGRMLPHMRASGPRRVEASAYPRQEGLPGPTTATTARGRTSFADDTLQGTPFGRQTGAARTARPAGWTPSRGARVSPTVSPHPKYAGRPPTASPHPGANITKHAMAGALATALFDDLDANQKAVLQEAAGRDWEPYPEEMDVPQYEAIEEITPSDIDTPLVSPEERIAEPGLGRMLGLRRSAEEIERDVAITEALDAGDYDRVAALEKQYGSSDWKESLTQRTKDYTPEQIEAMLSPDVSGSPLDVVQELFGDVEPSTEDSEYMSLMNKGGRVKPKKKKRKKSSKVSKSYSNKTRKPSRA